MCGRSPTVPRNNVGASHDVIFSVHNLPGVLRHIRLVIDGIKYRDQRVVASPYQQAICMQVHLLFNKLFTSYDKTYIIGYNSLVNLFHLQARDNTMHGSSLIVKVFSGGNHHGITVNLG